MSTSTAKNAALFLDTSVQIARVIHGPKTKAAIEERLRQHAETYTGLVARQEFKRRLLKEAAYLLSLLHKYASYGEVYQHIVRLPTTYSKLNRKKTICLQLLGQSRGMTDAEQTERLQLDLRSLLMTGLSRFDQKVDQVRLQSDCACGKTKVVEKVPLQKYVFGPDHCSRIKGDGCGIVAFLENHQEACARVMEKLRSLRPEEKSAELQNAQAFLERLVSNPQGARGEDPCLKAGDLMIAFESVGIPNFFTLNSSESQHLCKALDQTLIVQPINPAQSQIVCPKEQREWPPFGKKMADTARENENAQGETSP